MTSVTINIQTTRPSREHHGSRGRGATNIIATVSGNSGVVAVQFLLDGAPLGAEQIGPAHTSSFWLSCDTASVANGAHMLSQWDRHDDQPAQRRCHCIRPYTTDS
jgi:Big-like domain-containing protein